MKQPLSLLFFGSTTDSLKVLTALSAFSHQELDIQLVGVITKPPSPVGRDKIITTTPVEDWGREHNITVLSFASHPASPWKYQDESSVVEALSTFHPDLLVSASYGQIIPWKTINDAKYGGLNVHPSLLPRWRGADPIPWTILSGDHQAGATIVTLSEHFDDGMILGQQKIPITPTDTTDPLRETLFIEGAKLLCQVLPDYVHGDNKGELQKKEFVTTARRMKRDDGFIPRELLEKAILGEPIDESALPPFLFLLANKYGMPISPWPTVIERMMRALTPWPGVWTIILINGQEKRVKILELDHPTDESKLTIKTVQLEGKTPVSFEQFLRAYPIHSER